MIITGPPTHCAGCQTSNGRWRLSSSVVCNASGGPPGAWAVGRPTLHGGPVLLRPVRATPCFYVIFIHSYWRLSHGHLQQLSTLYCTFCCILPNLLHDISAVWFGIKWDVLGLLNTVDHCYTCDALVMAAEGKAIIFYCRFLKFVSIDERPAMVSQPNLASRSGVVSIYKCPPPQKKLWHPQNLGRIKHRTFFATSALDTAYFWNETSHRQTKMLLSIYDVSPKRLPTFRDLWLLIVTHPSAAITLPPS